MQVILTSRTWHKTHFPASLCMCIVPEEDKVLQKIAVGHRARQQLAVSRVALMPAPAGGLSRQPMSSSAGVIGRADMEPASTATCRAAAQLAPGRAGLPQLLSEGSKAARISWPLARGHPAEVSCMPSEEPSPAGRAGCQHPAWDSAGATVQAELAAGGGEETLQASSSMSLSLNCKLACKHRLSAPAAAWRGGANSFERGSRRSAAHTASYPWDRSSPRSSARSQSVDAALVPL